MNKVNKTIVHVIITVTLFVMIDTVFCDRCNAEDLRPGDQYIIIGTVYLTGVYQNLNNRQLKKHMTVGSLTAVKFSGPEVAFQCEVPAGTIMTIIDTAPKIWRIPFFSKRYYIHLDPDLSRGIDVILALNRGIEGNLDGLNPELFNRLE